MLRPPEYSGMIFKKKKKKKLKCKTVGSPEPYTTKVGCQSSQVAILPQVKKKKNRRYLNQPSVPPPNEAVPSFTASFISRHPFSKVKELGASYLQKNMCNSTTVFCYSCGSPIHIFKINCNNPHSKECCRDSVHTRVNTEDTFCNECDRKVRRKSS